MCPPPVVVLFRKETSIGQAQGPIGQPRGGAATTNRLESSSFRQSMPTEEGLLKNPVSGAGVLAAHAAAEREPNRRVRARCVLIRRLKAAQALHRANIPAATAAASRLRFTALAVR